MHVEDRTVDAALVDRRHGRRHAVDGPGDGAAQHVEKILEHHGNQGFVLNQEDARGRRHTAGPLAVKAGTPQPISTMTQDFASASRAAVANCCTENGFGRKET